MARASRPTTTILLSLSLLLWWLAPLGATADPVAGATAIARVDDDGYSFRQWYGDAGLPQEYRLLNLAIELIRKQVMNVAGPRALRAMRPARASAQWRFSLSPRKLEIGLRYRF